jgi:predicted phage tail protein
MKVRVYFHGHLRDKLKKEYFTVNADTAYDALKAIAISRQKDLKAPLDIGKWKIKIKDYDTKESWFVPLYTSELHVYPIFKTAKSNWAMVAVGVALMVVAPYLSGATAMGLGTTLYGTTTVGMALGSFAFTTGIALALSGAMNMLFPTPTLNTSQEASTNSKYLNGSNANTVAAGTRIPFGYGLFKVSGHFISYNISSTTIKVITKESA